MIHSKNNGFTLIEVLLATAIIAIVLTPIFSLQSSIAQRVVRASQSVTRMFVAYTFFLNKQKEENEDEKEITKKNQDPPMDLSYQIKEMPKNSDLAKSFNNLYIEKTTWQWQTDGGVQSDNFVHILFEPPEPEPEKDATKEAEKAGPQKQGTSTGSQKTGQEKPTAAQGAKK